MKKISLLILLLCIVPQVICLALRYVNEYNIAYSFDFYKLYDAVEFVSSLLYMASIFAAYAIVIYTVFIFGTELGGEWLIAMAGGYGIVYLLIWAIRSYAAGIILSALCTAVLIMLFVKKIKDAKSAAVILACVFAVTYAGGLIITLIAEEMSSYEIAESVIYALLNYGLDALMLSVAAQCGSVYRAKAIERNESVTIGGAVLPKKKPVLKAILAMDIVYTSVAVIGDIITTVTDIREYGIPCDASEWLEELLPYGKAAVFFVVAYFAAVLAANLAEDKYFGAEDYSRALNSSKGGKK